MLAKPPKMPAALARPNPPPPLQKKNKMPAVLARPQTMPTALTSPQNCREVLLKSFHLNGHTLGIYPQIETLEPSLYNIKNLRK